MATQPTAPKCIVISVPPGKIGLTLSIDRNSGATVTEIDDACKIKEKIQIGDRIVTIDGIQVTRGADFQVNSNKVRSFGIVKLVAAPAKNKASSASTTNKKPDVAPAAATPKRKASPKEKRLKRFRSSATIKIQERIERALHQRLFLIEASAPSTCPRNGGPSITFSVLGSTGNVYEVTISKVPHCSCPDAAKGNLCKHLLFVMLKVVGLPARHQLVYQSAYLTEELEEINKLMQTRLQRLGRDVVANAEVQKVHADLKNGIKAEDDTAVARKDVNEADCPICFDNLGSNTSLLTFCKGTCGTNFHKECIKLWTRQPSHQHSGPTCPACRQPWQDVETGGRKAGESSSRNEGYENLGRLQGQSPIRDTSTYHSRYDGYKRRRYY